MQLHYVCCSCYREITSRPYLKGRDPAHIYCLRCVLLSPLLIAVRTWREFWSPSRKCKRVGHNLDTRVIKFLVVDGSSSVADRYVGEQTYCKRCRHEQQPTRDKLLNSYSSVSMPNYQWDELHEKGFLRWE